MSVDYNKQLRHVAKVADGGHYDRTTGEVAGTLYTEAQQAIRDSMRRVGINSTVWGGTGGGGDFARPAAFPPPEPDPVPDALVLAIASPGVEYSAEAVLANFNYTSAVSDVAGATYFYLGWQPDVYGPARAVEVTIVSGDDLTGIRIGTWGNADGDPATDDPLTNSPTSGGLWIAGDGDVYQQPGGGAPTVVASGAPLVAGDVVSIKIDDWQYGGGSIAVNGTTLFSTGSDMRPNAFISFTGGLTPSA